MPSSATYTPTSPPAAHGGDFDPNEVRHAQSVNSAPGIASVNPSHGGNMDPNEGRHRLVSAQQTPGPSSPASPNGYGVVQTQVPSVQYGSHSHLVNTPVSPPSGYPTYQTPQTPDNVNPGSYFPAPNAHQSPYPSQASQSPQTPSQAQVSQCKPRPKPPADLQRAPRTIRQPAYRLRVRQLLPTRRRPHTDHLKRGR